MIRPIAFLALVAAGIVAVAALLVADFGVLKYVGLRRAR